MGFSLTPDFMVRSITDITPEMLKDNGISLLLMDLDNTMSPYKVLEPAEAVVKWAELMKESGITLYIVSNSKTERPELFAKRLKIGFCMKARKPSTEAILAAVRLNNVRKEEAALVGDQIFTDVLGANRSGVKSFLVYPIKFSNPLYVVRYIIELPFRHSKKRRRD